MIVAVKDHQRKSHGIVAALRSQGWFVVPIGAPADLLLIDHDVNRPAYRPVIQAYRERGAKIVLYPHSALPVWHWDGIEDPYPVDACLTISTGQRDVLAAYNYPYRVHTVGWSFCEQKPFQPKSAGSVLFAPIHPVGTGYLNPIFKEYNRQAYKTVLDWGIPVTVHAVGTLEMNGLWPVEGVEVEQSVMDTTLGSIDTHDLVVSARGTFASLAVARGKPTVMFQQVPAAYGPESPDEEEVLAANWERYQESMRYPYDIADPDAVGSATKTEASDWRERFIGPQMDPGGLSDLLAVIVREGTTSDHPAGTLEPGGTRTRSPGVGDPDAGPSTRQPSPV